MWGAKSDLIKLSFHIGIKESNGKTSCEKVRSEADKAGGHPTRSGYWVCIKKAS
jgi:hypothetical protein